MAFSTLHGLRGDTWEARGADTASGRADPLRQITIMNSRVLATIAGARDRWQFAGDQLIVDLDISIDNLPAGARLQIGEAVAQVTEPPHTGCAKFAGRFGADCCNGRIIGWAGSCVDGACMSGARIRHGTCGRCHPTPPVVRPLR